MIQFGLHTFRAEINAWPCPPDEFVIVISATEHLHGSNQELNARLEKLAKPFAHEYEICSDYFQTIMAHVLRFKRYERQPEKCHVHDIILERVNPSPAHVK